MKEQLGEKSERSPAFEHKPWRVAVIVASAAVFVIMLFFNTMSGFPGAIPGLFVNSLWGSDSKTTYISPAGWTFSIWGVIFIWQIVFLVYGVSTIFRYNSDGYLYYSLGLMPISVYIIYIINNLTVITWLILFDREYYIISSPILALIAITLYIALVISHRAVNANVASLKTSGLMKEVWRVRFMVQNAWATYATWCTIATLLNTSKAMVYSGGMDKTAVSTGMLGFLSFIIVSYSIADFFFIHKFTNYLFMPFVVLPFALTGVIARNFDPWTGVTIFEVLLLGVTLALLVIKIGLMVWRHRSKRSEVRIGDSVSSTKGMIA